MEERVDVNNGLLLCPNHDWLFDKGFISFDDTGAIIISSKLCHNNQVFMNIDDIQYIEMSDKIKEYIQYHRTNIYRRWDWFLILQTNKSLVLMKIIGLVKEKSI